MSNYSKVQFISWEVYTGPIIVDQQAGIGLYPGLRDQDQDKRTGVLGQCRDIDARVAFTADALAKAEAASDRSPSTLKIFMAPEFLYRGAGGAYLNDLLNGWQPPGAPAEFGLPAPYNGPWPGLFGALRALVARSAFEDWVFVFGTAISASFPTRKATSGKYVLDPSQPGEIYNSALIQRGGTGHTADAYVSRKQYISGIDFINWYGAVQQHMPGTVEPADPEAVVPEDAMGVPEGSAVFRLPAVNDGTGAPIDFGIEICLDHASSGGNHANAFGRIRTANQYVKIQLVPSAGMRLKPESIRLQPAGGPTPNSYAFNCDGLATMAGNEYGSHTQVWNGANGAIPAAANRLIEISGGTQLANTVVQAVAPTVATPLGQVAASMLWNNGGGVQGAGNVRVMAPRDL
ncbi:hypothetical protein IP92_05420 [Pseudoduganella flava]|uniref:Uncharacterized protein n=1 Tax=Pseudoduganella flava TaxID=871742 RepID=A0A562PDD9_9BURK|nr:hypothetical protein [Pseudoduganella flava]QGZ42175.1 hypothetical protein GO485_26115 [Pseudoduganella flava]TWI42444.1 hypothetical protein IP92_05420 [Pseudoduganella flava]